MNTANTIARSKQTNAVTEGMIMSNDTSDAKKRNEALAAKVLGPLCMTKDQLRDALDAGKYLYEARWDVGAGHESTQFVNCKADSLEEATRKLETYWPNKQFTRVYCL